MFLDQVAAQVLSSQARFPKWLNYGLGRLGRSSHRCRKLWSPISATFQSLVTQFLSAVDLILLLRVDHRPSIHAVSLDRPPPISLEDKSTAYIELYSKWKLVRRLTRWRWASHDMRNEMLAISRDEHTEWFRTEFDKILFLILPRFSGLLTGWLVSRGTLVEGNWYYHNCDHFSESESLVEWFEWL